MTLATRAVASLAGGLLAAALTYVAAAAVVSPAEVWFAVGLNAVVWTCAIGIYLHSRARLQRLGATADELSTATAGTWGGVAGGFVSVGTTGVYLLATSLPFRFVATISLFVFGVALGSMAIGMGVVAERFDARETAAGERGARDGAVADD